MPVQKYEPTEDDLKWMRLAIDVAKKSEGEPGRVRAEVPHVGVVIVKDGVLLGTAHRGEGDPYHHAEYALLEGKLAGVDLKGATAYTTLEPCSDRNPPKVSCADRLIQRGIARVFVGAYDPNPNIYRLGWTKLHREGIELRDFPRELRDAIAMENAQFHRNFSVGVGTASEKDVRIGAGLHNPEFVIYVDETRSQAFRTAWSARRNGTAIAYKTRSVAVAKGATCFADVDDPTALMFSDHHTIRTGDIVAFREPHGCALVQLKGIRVVEEDEIREVTIAWELRLE